MTDNERYKKPKMVQIPHSLYQDLIRYFLLGIGGLGEDEYYWTEQRIRQGLQEKQEANERRLLYSAKLANERRLSK